jgi:hypothetical protein
MGITSNAYKQFVYELSNSEGDPNTRPSSPASSTGDPNNHNKRKRRLLTDEEYEAFTAYYKSCYPEKFSSLNYVSQGKNIIDQKINEIDKQKFKELYTRWRLSNPIENLTEFAKELCKTPLSGGRSLTTKRKAKKRHNKRKTRR